MFRGANAITMDTKGRLTVPTRYREPLRACSGGQLICTVDIHSPCLLLYPLPEWERVEQKLMSLSDTQPAERAIKRLLLGYASEGELDKAGRLLLSAPLRQYAELDKSVMLVGQLNKFEVWSEANWQAQIQAAHQQVSAADILSNPRLQDLSL
ncbi:division/cell wall cluster transcriptional repressor MraZ [Ferrimonas balearica]|uniref:division/cell wall cluster transcriptional repressor MraZ n=1 Tax=Ferrimonas balearica TaxID=44012 RepID=UPI001C9A18AC|nr:division/cell wall cluster transcriptional repressor MraZ [Ferrimonas balearica]MBY5923208.1 division/cell wall cluster transcriptional repressor MraZ [Ferrimonas balearica]MBY5997416.1 division/cell wall cluster transcriptional repressor MraZ [Ferrimonas balearica]